MPSRTPQTCRSAKKERPARPQPDDYVDSGCCVFRDYAGADVRVTARVAATGIDTRPWWLSLTGRTGHQSHRLDRFALAEDALELASYPAFRQAAVPASVSVPLTCSDTRE